MLSQLIMTFSLDSMWDFWQILIWTKNFISDLCYSIHKKSGEQAYNRRASINLHYLNLSILLGFHLNQKFSVYLGLALGRRLNELRKSIDPSTFFVEFYEKSDVSLIFGGQYRVNSRSWVDLPYIHGLGGLVMTSTFDATGNINGSQKFGYNRVIQMGIFSCKSK